MLGWLKSRVNDRADYSQAVRRILNDELVIETDSGKNPRFASAFMFEQLISKGFYSQRTAADTAAEIALSYFMGNCKADKESKVEAEGVGILLDLFLLRVSGTEVDRHRASQFSTIIKRYRQEYLEARS